MVNTNQIIHVKLILEDFLKYTRNQYQVVSVRQYNDKKGLLPEGYTLTLMILHDDFDYGVDQKGEPKENNQYQNFDVTVLNRKHAVKKGDMVRLLDFDDENSFPVGFDMVFRFKDYEVIKLQGKEVQNDKK